MRYPVSVCPIVSAVIALFAHAALANPLTAPTTTTNPELTSLLRSLPVQRLKGTLVEGNHTLALRAASAAATDPPILALCPMFDCSNSPPCYLFDLTTLSTDVCYSTHLFDSVAIIVPSGASFSHHVEVALGGCQDNVAVLPSVNVCYNLNDIAPLDAFVIF